jgi:ABC-type maltose transport system permease subunit
LDRVDQAARRAVVLRGRVHDLLAEAVLPHDPGGPLGRCARRRGVVPLAKPAIAAVALFQFLYSWNDFFSPLLYLVENPDQWTLSIALSEFESQFHVQWNLTMAASVLFMVPVIVLFFLAQRVFVEGVTLTGVKG